MDFPGPQNSDPTSRDGHMAQEILGIVIDRKSTIFFVLETFILISWKDCSAGNHKSIGENITVALLDTEIEMDRGFGAVKNLTDVGTAAEFENEQTMPEARLAPLMLALATTTSRRNWRVCSWGYFWNTESMNFQLDIASYLFENMALFADNRGKCP